MQTKQKIISLLSLCTKIIIEDSDSDDDLEMTVSAMGDINLYHHQLENSCYREKKRKHEYIVKRRKHIMKI